ncbi:MAG: tetratricopeptide repeat protein [Ignavibacteria bacterium]
MKKHHIHIHIVLILTTIAVLFISASKTYPQAVDNRLDLAYNYLNEGKIELAIYYFEDYIKDNPSEMRIYLQLGYAYKQTNQLQKARQYFNYVIKNSTDSNEINLASLEIGYIEQAERQDNKKNENPVVVKDQSDDDLLNEGYEYLRTGNTKKAIESFERYIKDHPEATKIYLQLAYLYDKEKRYSRALDYFDYVASHSSDIDEIDAARKSMFIEKQMIALTSPRSLDLYFYNGYDSYYQNYISNFVGHINFRVLKNFYLGFYGDVYMDSKSKKDYILNDRFVEGGGFMKLRLSDNFNFEFRLGYVHEIDFEKNSVNFKPMLTYGNRFGNPAFYLGRSTKTEYFYVDLYSVELYDYKFKNLFGQLQLKEVLRYMTGGYSYFEFYLVQLLQADSRQLDYNNYGEFGVGATFKPNLINFPTLFVEGTNRLYLIGQDGQYFSGNLRNNFTLKAGFIINFNFGL